MQRTVSRRQAIRLAAALCAGAASSLIRAQGARRDAPARIAIVDDASEDIRAELWAAFRKRLGELGYDEGRNLQIDWRYAGGDLRQLDRLANEAVARNPDVVVAVTTTVALAVKKATAKIPIVALGPADPVKSGLVASLSRPGGNLTGASPNQAELAGKWLQLVRDLVPPAKSVAYLTDRGNPGEMVVFGELEARARPLGMSAIALDGVTSAGVDAAFAAMAAQRTDALIVATSSSLLGQRKQIVEQAARARLPAIYARKEYVDAGGLLSYATDTARVFYRGAEYVSRILRGAAPADLPFEMASTFTLVLNATTARTLGVDIPRTVRVRADQVVE